jgi:hypothetical protein
MAMAALMRTVADLGGEAGIKGIMAQDLDKLTPEQVLGAQKVRDMIGRDRFRRWRPRPGQRGTAEFCAAIYAKLLHAAPSHLVCIPSGYRQGRSCLSRGQLAALTWSLRKTEGMARLHLLALNALSHFKHLDKTSPALASKILPQVGGRLFESLRGGSETRQARIWADKPQLRLARLRGEGEGLS